MAKSGKSLFDRIGSVKNSLENAEQSFKDNQDMRGELDLMLAEAELKNLRRKKDVPWTWNRHVLAICVACMVFFGGLVGWYFAVDQYQDVNAKGTPIINSASKVQKSEQAKNVMPSKQASVKDDKMESPQIKSEPQQGSSELSITKNDMRRLVRSARVELSNSK